MAKPVPTSRNYAPAIKRAPAGKRARGGADPKKQIENLQRELKESLQQQAATADVLRVISRSKVNLQSVLATLAESASRLCDAYDAVILLRDDEWLIYGAHHGPIPVDFKKWPINRAWTAGRAVVDRKLATCATSRRNRQNFRTAMECRSGWGTGRFSRSPCWASTKPWGP
jgi:hypothetical protein